MQVLLRRNWFVNGVRYRQSRNGPTTVPRELKPQLPKDAKIVSLTDPDEGEDEQDERKKAAAEAFKKELAKDADDPKTLSEMAAKTPDPEAAAREAQAAAAKKAEAARRATKQKPRSKPRARTSRAK